MLTEQPDIDGGLYQTSYAVIFHTPKLIRSHSFKSHLIFTTFISGMVAL